MNEFSNQVPRCPNYDLLIECAKTLATMGSNVQEHSVTYLEIGCNAGHSLYRVMESNLIRHALAIDTWGDQHGGQGKRNGEHVARLCYNMMHRITLLTGDSHRVLPGLLGCFDLIFVDGDHSHAGCRADLENSVHLLSPGGFIVVDDVDNPSARWIRQVTADFAARFNFNVEWYPHAHQGVAILNRNV